MNSRLKSSKLLELRARTDRQLVEFVSSRLNAGLTFARLATDPDVHDRWASTAMFQEKACAVYCEVAPLVPLVGNLSEAERRVLESKLDRLRPFAEERTACVEAPAGAACA
jgi:hypothetical protein